MSPRRADVDPHAVAQVLSDLELAAQRLASAEADIKRLVLDAAEIGATGAQIADACQTSRATVSRWLRGDPHTLPSQSRWLTTMHAALDVAIELGGDTDQARQGRAASDLPAVARRLRIAASNTDRTPTAGSAAAHTLTQGLLVATAVLEMHATPTGRAQLASIRRHQRAGAQP